MGPLGIEFEWFRDAKGYRYEEAVPRPPFVEPPVDAPTLSTSNTSVRLPESFADTRPRVAHGGKPARIVRNGGSLIRYHASESLDLIFREFINIETNPEGVLGFINRFGPISADGNDIEKGESVAFVNTMKFRISETIDRVAEIDNSERAAALEGLLGADGLTLGGLEVRIVFDHRTMSPKPQIVAKDLFAALWARMIELLFVDNAGTVLRRCAHCNALFTAGAGTGRRLDAKFCTDEHRFAFHRLRDAQDEPPGQPRRRGRPRRTAP